MTLMTTWGGMNRVILGETVTRFCDTRRIAAGKGLISGTSA